MKTLIVINYCMDIDDPVLSHQVATVNELSKYFKRVIVLTGRIGNYTTNSNVQVKSFDYDKRKKIRVLFRFIFIFLRITFNHDQKVVFSHMTDIYSAIISPFTKIMRIKHYLWYAHTHKSIYLQWSHIWVNKIITSTSGSCPIKSRKIFVIGQGVNSKDFPFFLRDFESRKEIIHIGRFDPKKNISKIIETVAELRKIYSQTQLKIIGSSTSVEYSKIAEILKYEIVHIKKYSWVEFLPSVTRSMVPDILNSADIFLHAYEGSLDKTLIEATMSGIPVVTINREYLSEFGTWGESNSNQLTLLSEINSYLEKPSHEVMEIVRSRFDKASKSHSLLNWVNHIQLALNE